MPIIKNTWFYYVSHCIKCYPDDIGTGTQAWIAKGAIHTAIERTKAMPDGDDRIRLIDTVYWSGRKNRAGAAMEMYISEATAKRWTDGFVYLCADLMGFQNNGKLSQKRHGDM